MMDVTAALLTLAQNRVELNGQVSALVLKKVQLFLPKKKKPTMEPCKNTYILVVVSTVTTLRSSKESHLKNAHKSAMKMPNALVVNTGMVMIRRLMLSTVITIQETVMLVDQASALKDVK